MQDMHDDDDDAAAAGYADGVGIEDEGSMSACDLPQHYSISAQLRDIFFGENPDDRQPRAVFEEAMNAIDHPTPSMRINTETAFCRFMATYQAHHSPRVAAIAATLAKKPTCFYHVNKCPEPPTTQCIFCNLCFCAAHVAYHPTKRYSYKGCARCIPNLVGTYRSNALDPECPRCWKICNLLPCTTCSKYQLCPHYTTIGPAIDFCLCPIAYHTDPETWMREVYPYVKDYHAWPLPNKDRIIELYR